MEILYEDNHLIVVKKEPGILSQGDKTEDKDLLTEIKKYIKEKYNKPGNVFLGLVHRLDRMVGGVMVFAKTSKAASRLSEQIRNRSFKKGYYAVVHGIPKDKNILINHLIKNKQTNMVSVVSEENIQAKRAELSYELLETNNNLSLVDIKLKTGRPHQIRVQFAHIQNPLYGDKRYGNKADKHPIALFSYYLSFQHPTTKEKLIFKMKPNPIYPFKLFNIID